MSQITLLLLSILALSCDTNTNSSIDTPIAPNHNTEFTTEVSNDPYSLSIQLVENQLVVVLDPNEGSYFASPFAKDQVNGYFDILLPDNKSLELTGEIQESPLSTPSLDHYSGNKVRWIKQKTTYTRSFAIKKNTDFEVTGTVRFVIEPKCTLEKINFKISSKEGKLTVKKIQ